MTKLKMVLWGLVAAAIVLALGWLWGSSGRWDAEAGRRDAALRLDLADGRGALAMARVDLFELNYGQASRHLQEAKEALTTAAESLEAGSRRDEANAVRQALTKVVEAQQFSSSVNTTANERTAEALEALAALGRPAGASPAK
jgi:hypothetical protein